jgi:hypothetical protein
VARAFDHEVKIERAAANVLNTAMRSGFRPLGGLVLRARAASR